MEIGTRAGVFSGTEAVIAADIPAADSQVIPGPDDSANSLETGGPGTHEVDAITPQQKPEDSAAFEPQSQIEASAALSIHTLQTAPLQSGVDLMPKSVGVGTAEKSWVTPSELASKGLPHVASEGQVRETGKLAVEQPLAFAALLVESDDSKPTAQISKDSVQVPRDKGAKAPSVMPAADAPVAVPKENSVIDGAARIKPDGQPHYAPRALGRDQPPAQIERTEQAAVVSPGGREHVQSGQWIQQLHVREGHVREAPVENGVQNSEALQVRDIGGTSHSATSIRSDVKDIAFRIQGQTGSSVEIRLVERGGSVQVTVRSSDPVLSNSLRGELAELVKVLGERGYRTETWTPADTFPTNHVSGLDTRGSGANESSPDWQRDSQQGDGSQQQRRQQQQQPKSEWIAELERRLESEDR
jgi:hypothetical protein